MHSDLIAKLEALDGPSREVDLELTTKFFGGREADLHRAHGLHCYDFTSSLDAAIALVERMLPGWLIASLGQDDGKKWHAELRQGYRTSYSTVALAGAPTPAIALLIATLKALEARDG